MSLHQYISVGPPTRSHQEDRYWLSLLGWHPLSLKCKWSVVFHCCVCPQIVSIIHPFFLSGLRQLKVFAKRSISSWYEDPLFQAIKAINLDCVNFPERRLSKPPIFTTTYSTMSQTLVVSRAWNACHWILYCMAVPLAVSVSLHVKPVGCIKTVLFYQLMKVSHLGKVVFKRMKDVLQK